MPLPDVTITDDAGLPPGVIDFGDVQVGVPSVEIPLRINNNLDGAGVVDTARGFAFNALGRLKDSGDPFEAAGVALLDSRATEAKIESWSDGVTGAVVTAWQPLGSGHRLDLPEIPGTIGGEWVRVLVRLNPPATLELEPTELAFNAVAEIVFPMPPGGTPNEVPTGRGDNATSDVISGEPLVVTGVPYELETGLVTWFHEGRGPFPQQAGLLLFDDLDFNNDALLAGEAYILLLSRRRAESFVVTKGVKNTTPLTDDDRPAIPAGDVPHAWVEVPFGGTPLVVTETPQAAPQYWKALPSGLVLQIGAGRAFPEGYDVRRETTTDLGALPTDETVDVFLARDGGLSAVASVDPVPVGRPMRLYQVVTDATDIVNVIDLRRLEGGGFTAA